EWGVAQGYAERFQTEARSMARLHHNHIVAVYDFGLTSAGHLYLVMEYVDGQTLHDMIRYSRLTLPMVQGVALQLCDAIGYAHENGILHRDLKPGNVLMNTSGQAKVADFGLARHAGAAVEEVSLGTPEYAAPEILIEGALVDHRADIFALGVLFQEMLTGQVPGRPREPLSAHGQFDSGWESVIQRAMHHDPDARFATARELALAIADVGKIKPVAKPARAAAAPMRAAPAPSHPRAPQPSARASFPWAPVLALLAVAAVAVVWWMQNRKDVEVVLNPAPQPAATKSATDRVADASSVPEQVKPAMPASPSDVAVGKKALATGSPMSFPDVPAGHMFKLKEGQKDMLYDVVLFPDQRHAATCGADGHVGIWDLQNGEKVRTYGPTPGTLVRLAVSGDGKYVAAGGNDYKTYLWSLDDGDGARATEVALTARFVTGLCFSEDGETLLIGTSDVTQSLVAWHWRTGTLDAIPGFRQPVSGLEVRSGDVFYASGARFDNGKMAGEVWQGSVSRLSLVQQLGSVEMMLSRVRITPDGRTACTAQSGRITSWDIASGHTIAQSTIAPGTASWEFVDGGRLILCGGQDRCLHLVETVSGAEVWKSEPIDTYCTNYVTATADGKYAVSVGGAKFGNPVEKDGDYSPHVWRLPSLADLKSGNADKALAKQDMLRLENSDAELWTLLGKLAGEWDEKAVKGEATERKSLDEKYLGAVRRELASAGPRDREAFLSEISRIANRDNTPLLPSAPPSLVRLHGIYQQQLNLLPQKAQTTRVQLAMAQRLQLDALEKQRADAGNTPGAARVALAREALVALNGEMVLAKIQDYFKPKPKPSLIPSGLTSSTPLPVTQAEGEIPTYSPRELGLARPSRLHKIEVWPRSTVRTNTSKLGDVPADLGPVVALAVGDRHALALKPDGTVVQWGHEDSRTLAVPAGLDHIVAIAAGSSLSAALRDDGVAIAWNSTKLLPQRTNASPAIAIHSANAYALLRHRDGSLTYMGSGPNTGNASYSPPQGLTGCVDVVTSASSTFALMQDGTVRGWGKNSSQNITYHMSENMPT
ncbi:MAG: protein kinase domain-containing protein, partial [Roseimicrobium sp.]